MHDSPQVLLSLRNHILNSNCHKVNIRLTMLLGVSWNPIILFRQYRWKHALPSPFHYGNFYTPCPHRGHTYRVIVFNSHGLLTTVACCSIVFVLMSENRPSNKSTYYLLAYGDFLLLISYKSILWSASLRSTPAIQLLTIPTAESYHTQMQWYVYL